MELSPIPRLAMGEFSLCIKLSSEGSNVFDIWPETRFPMRKLSPKFSCTYQPRISRLISN